MHTIVSKPYGELKMKSKYKIRKTALSVLLAIEGMK